MHLYHGRANAIRPYERDITMYKHLSNPRNPENPDSKIIYRRYSQKTTMSPKIHRAHMRVNLLGTQSSVEIVRANHQVLLARNSIVE